MDKVVRNCVFVYRLYERLQENEDACRYYMTYTKKADIIGVSMYKIYGRRILSWDQQSL